VTLVAYYPAWQGAPLWDDDAHLTRPELRSIQGLGRIWFDVGATQQYYPVVHSAFWVMHRLWGDATLGYHLVTIAIHATSAWLVFLILTRLAAPGALFAAAIFALHPVHVESVAWMTELKNTLSGVWYLAALLAYLRFDATRSRVAYALSALLFLMALFSKTVTATLPAALLVIFWWRRGSLRWREDVAPLVPLLALGVAGGLMTAWVERTLIGATGAAFDFTVVERCLIAGRAFWFYLASLAWPANLAFIYPRWAVSQAVWWQYLFPLGALALFAWLWRYRDRSRAPLSAALFFAGTLVPALGFVNVYPFVYSFVADHFQYLASLGPIALVSGGAALGARRRQIAPAVALLMLVPLIGLTWRQSARYTDAETLYRATIATSPTSWMAHINLGKLLQDRAGPPPGDRRLLEAALAEFDAAIAAAPRVAPAHNNRGAVLEALGRPDEAVAAYREALTVTPGDPDVLFNLSLALTQAGKPAEGAETAESLIRMQPHRAAAHASLADARLALGQLDPAVTAYRESLRLSPDDASAHNGLGTALARQGRIDEAVAEFREALRFNPRFARARVNLGAALVRQGRPDEALVWFREAAAIQPDLASAHYQLATALEALGRHAEAVAAYRDTVRLQPGFVNAHNELGVALAEIGRYAEAADAFREAVRLQPDFADARANLARVLRLLR
jgi:tetratricopeptide (TPR) repeat protein